MEVFKVEHVKTVLGVKRQLQHMGPMGALAGKGFSYLYGMMTRKVI